MDCPEYRLRLFMSADLVGSTAFKANKKQSELRTGSASPAWVDEFRAFYKDFPIAVTNSYRKIINASGDELSDYLHHHPLVWKTIGDEIIFCSRVHSVEHAAASVSSFLKALEQYSKQFEDDEKPLRLKGAGWLAAFPAPNISISISSDATDDSRSDVSDESENTESFEASADLRPNRFDFLGKGIDTGFRVAKNASEDRFVTSVQLGYVLARAAVKRRFPHTFGYHGRESLKGVIDGSPYPVVSVDTERSEIKAKLKSREAALTGETGVQPHALHDFLETFMVMANIDTPCLGEGSQPWGNDFPESYLRYQSAFEENLRIDDENIKQVSDALDPEIPDDRSLEDPKSYLDSRIPLVETEPESGVVTGLGTAN